MARLIRFLHLRRDDLNLPFGSQPAPRFMSAIFSFQSADVVWCLHLPLLSTAAVTGMSTTLG